MLLSISIFRHFCRLRELEWEVNFILYDTARNFDVNIHSVSGSLNNHLTESNRLGWHQDPG